MIVCIPVIDQRGLEAEVSHHFGRAPYHLVVDTRSLEFELIAKPADGPGHCMPVALLVEHRVALVLCKGLGRKAFENLQHAGIKTMLTHAGSAASALAEYEGGRVEPVSENVFCDSGHQHAH